MRLTQLDWPGVPKSLNKMGGRKAIGMVTLNPGEDFHLQAESAPDPILAVDNQMRLVVFNTAAEAFLGYERQQVLGRHLNSLLIGGFGPISLAKLQEAVASGHEGQVGDTHVSARHNQGYQLAVEASLSLLHDQDRGFHVVATLRNEEGSKEKEPRLQVIQRINHLLTDTGPWEVRFSALLEEMRQLASIQWMGLILLSPGGRLASMHNSQASYRTNRITSGMELKLSGWLAKAMRPGQRVLRRIRPRGGHALEKQLYLDGLRQMMVLPLSLGDRTLGALALGSMKSEGLTDEQAELMEQLTPQFAISLDRELGQENLATSQRQYEHLLDNLHEAVFRADVSGRLEFANMAMARLMDCQDTRSLMTGTASIPFFDPAAGRELMTTLELKGSVSDQRVELLNCQGEPTFYNLSAKMVYDRFGTPIAIEGTLQDLTELERLNHALAESEARFQKVLADSEDLILLANDDGLITEVNQAAIDLLDMTRKQLLGRSVEEIMEQYQERSMSGPSTDEVDQMIEVFTREGERVEVWQDETQIQKPALDTSQTTPASHDEALPPTSDEIEHNVNGLEERLSAHREGLANSEQLTEMGELVASIARELNDPYPAPASNGDATSGLKDKLSTINELIDQFEQLAGRVEQTPELEEMVDSLRRMRTRVTRDSLAEEQQIPRPPFEVDLELGRPDETAKTNEISSDTTPGKNLPVPSIPETPIQLSAVNINQEVESNLKSMEQQLRSKATVIFEPGELPQVACDREQVGQVMMNLLLNAAESIGQLGTIKVRTRVDGDQAVVEITDDGVGLTRRELERIFDAFYTTKEANGLGLTISRSIIEAHGGQIQVRSKQGAGSTFSIHLPLPDIGHEHRPPDGPGDLGPSFP